METDDDAPLVLGDDPPPAPRADPPNCTSRYYTLPALRFLNLVRVVLFIDAIVMVALWLAAGSTNSILDSIIKFQFMTSTFDLAVLSMLKLIALVIAYSVLEDVTLTILSKQCNSKPAQRKKLLHAVIVVISSAALIYSIIKGSLILNALINHKDYVKMPVTFDAMAIAAVVFGFIEFAFSLMTFSAMRRLKVMRQVHRLDMFGQEIDKDGEPIKRHATLGRVIALARPEACLIGVATLCLMVSSSSSIAGPLFFGQVIDAAKHSMGELNRMVMIYLLVCIAGSIGGMFRSWLFTLAGQRLVARLRTQLFESIIRQEVAFFDTNRTGELTNRLASDTQVIQNAITVNISMLVRYTVNIIGSLVLMFILKPSLTGVLLSVVPIISIGAVQYGKYVKKLQKDFQDRLADASTTAEENISSIRTVRSFVGEEKASHNYGQDIDKSYQVGKKLAFIQGTFEGAIGIVSSAAITLVLWYGGKLIFEGSVTPGILTSFLLYTLQVAMTFAMLSSLFGDFMKAVGASTRVFELMDRSPKVPSEGGQVFITLQAGVEFEDVHFTYPSRPDTKVLRGVSFGVSQGQMVALVGPSGGGKSTIVSLIERFYDPDSGLIKLGGDNLRQLDPKWFRTQIALVSQEPTLFACSVKDNISYGKQATMDEIIEAAKQANAHDFIMSFEEGYDTKVGERGVRLSGGQKQRVAIARALIMNPALLLLDEATSALDAESEHLVQEAIDRAMISRTVVVIAHRLSTVRNASKVVVIDKGTIVEQGTHEELIAADGVYKKLILRQLMAGSGEQPSNGDDDDPLIDLSTNSTTRHSPAGTSDVPD